MAHKIRKNDNLINGEDKISADNEETLSEDDPRNHHQSCARPYDRQLDEVVGDYDLRNCQLDEREHSHSQAQQRITGHPIYGPHRRTTTPGAMSRNRTFMAGIDWSDDEALQNIMSPGSSPDRFLASQGSPYMNNLLNIVSSTDDGMHQKNIKLSRRIPKWVWYFLAKALGIKLTQTDKPIIATILHVVTLTIAMVYAVSGLWYDIEDILSEYSKTTVLIGSVAIMLGLGWICLGIYAHKLAGRLFSNKNFVESVRMHSKTFMKISTVGLLMLLGLLNIGVYSYESYNHFVRNDSACMSADTYTEICIVMYCSMVTYSIICLSWNILVGCVLLSVCRTHTISIRRFMRELSLDAKIFELNLKHKSKGKTTDLGVLIDKSEDFNDLSDWFVWDDRISTDPRSDVVTSQPIFLQSITGQVPVNSIYVPNNNDPSALKNFDDQSQEVLNDEIYNIDASVEDKDRSDSTENKSLHLPPEIMPNENLLFSYWKLCQRLTVTSRYLQRWLSSWIAFIVIWCADYIVYWTTHSATLPGILQFILPLLLLLIICSAYAEVNSEGQRMLRCICPSEERLSILFFMYQQPLQMQVFSFAITYNALLGVILAFSVAFSSRIILDEVLK